MDKQVIITIGREYGSGGHVIAQDIAKRFNVPYYNRNLIEEVAKQNNFEVYPSDDALAFLAEMMSHLENICSLVPFRDTAILRKRFLPVFSSIL